MPATLPWPKMAQTPPKIGTFATVDLTVIWRVDEKGQRLRHRQADGLGHGVFFSLALSLSDVAA